MKIAILLFEGFTALDAIGPYEVLRLLPGAEIQFVAATAGPKRTDQGSLAVVADHGLSSVPSADVLVVPGGPGQEAAREDPAVLDWVRLIHATSQWTTSVCTGSLILGAAGILRGLRATSHWMYLDRLPAFGAEPTLERVVEQGKVITAAGVSSGIDMGLRLAQRIAGEDVAQTIQLVIEYDPQPPFDAGSPSKAPAHLVEFVRRAYARARDASGKRIPVSLAR
ncbi:MAG: DJ-1/PfpI family protein [Candidatus Binatia bacterium]